jgi:DNA-binding NtrC family response regulator
VVVSQPHTLRELLEALVEALVSKGVPYDEARQAFEKRYVERALQEADGSVSGAAGVMGVHRNTVTRKMAEYRIKA